MTDLTQTFPDKWLLPTIEELTDSDNVSEALAGEEGVAQTLWQTAVGKGLVTDEQLLNALSVRFKLTLADVSASTREAREIVPEPVARKFGILPVRVTDSYLEIATANPFDLDCDKTLSFATGRDVRMAVASPSRITEAIDELYRPEKSLEKLREGMGDAEVMQLEQEEEQLEEVTAAEASQRPVVRLVDLILSEGVTSRASDIHIEPEEKGIAVRYRIDGVLRKVMGIPRAAGLPLISRIKIISDLDIADRLRPQDGRARVAVAGVPVDLRISTLPAALGEKVVIRILDSSTTVLNLDSLGFSSDEVDLIKELLEHRDGIILVTGPTGSGKTTTLYSALRHVQGEGVNIVTVEDPVEYRLQGIVQVQVHEKAGLTFAAALRSILRQDPDIVLVGEIRDEETATIAIQASLTGHLVLSTLHTNDAPNAVTRLNDIGVESYKIGQALRGVVAQRLMRGLCGTCRASWVEEIPKKLRNWIPEGTPLYRAVGCPECAMTGYSGRFSIVQILKIMGEVKKRITAGMRLDKIVEAAQQSGMTSLWDSGLRHVLAGQSTIDELLRVVDMPGEDEAYTSPAGTAPAAVRADDGGGRAAGTEFELLDEVKLATVSGDGISVLLVDDEDQLRRVMKDLLERDGYVVVEAADGVEALAQVDRHAPDIIVLDLSLPNLDGFGVLTNLKSRPATSDIPVVVLTAKGDEDSEVRVFEHGADDFLSKPFRARSLSARLKAVLERAGR